MKVSTFKITYLVKVYFVAADITRPPISSHWSQLMLMLSQGRSSGSWVRYAMTHLYLYDPSTFCSNMGQRQRRKKCASEATYET